MVLLTYFLMACVLRLGWCHHCTKNDKWNEIRTVLKYLGHPRPDARDLILEVVKRQSGTEVYKKLVKKRCSDRSFPRFHTLEELISKDAAIEKFILNTTHNHLRAISIHNFEYLTTLALSVSVHLDRYACENVKDINHVFNLLGANHRDVDVKRLFSMVIRHYNPRDVADDKESMIVHNNRLQCLSLGMVEEGLPQIHKTELHHPPKRSINETDEHIQYKDNDVIGGLVVESDVNPVNGIVAYSDAKPGTANPHRNKSSTKRHKVHQTKLNTSSVHTEKVALRPHHHHHTNTTKRHYKKGPSRNTRPTASSAHKGQSNFYHHTRTTTRHHRGGPAARPTKSSEGHKPKNNQPANHHHKQSPSQRKQQLIFTQKLFVSSSAIVSAILRGVNIYPDSRSCMIDHLEYIMQRYGHKRNILNEIGLYNLITDITDWKALSTKDRKHNQINPHQLGHHESNCKQKPRSPVSRLFVDVDNTKFYVNFTDFLQPKDILMLEMHNGKHLSMNKAQFLDVCPSIVYSLLQRATDVSSEQTDDTALRRPSALETYGLGTASVFIISLCSLLGALFVKITRKMVREYAMGMLLSLSVGCLIGDAVLHLIPDILVKDEEEVQTPRIPETLTKQCALLASIYGFFLLELTLSLIKSSNEDKEMKEISEQNLENECKCVDDMGKANSSLAWMVVIGDAIHNFADGLAIGAAFNKDVTVGLSTSIAVFCHELPHELGDFAALISTGMSIKKAIFWNFVSSLTAFGGLYIGIVVSSNDVARSWIFSVGAGMFIYVALANLVPEVQSYLKKFPDLCMFLSLNIGLLLGYVSMLLLAVYEDDLKLTWK